LSSGKLPLLWLAKPSLELSEGTISVEQLFIYIKANVRRKSDSIKLKQYKDLISRHLAKQLVSQMNPLLVNHSQR
jgi:hypothetical protein